MNKLIQKTRKGFNLIRSTYLKYAGEVWWKYKQREREIRIRVLS